MHRVYIAGPFFKPEQKDIIEEIENLLDAEGHFFFSPREFGVITDGLMTTERTKRIFDMNIRMVKACDMMIAVTDDFDPGTMFELGAFYMKPKVSFGNPGYGDIEKIITYSPAGWGSNVMIAHATFTHTMNVGELELAIRGHKVNEPEATQ